MDRQGTMRRDEERAILRRLRVRRLARLAVSVVAVFLASSVLLAAWVTPWESVRRVECKSNLKLIGRGLFTYATGNRGGYFPTPYSKADTERAKKERWGGPDAWDEKTFALKDRGKEGAKIDEHDPFTCNLSCLWMLVRGGYLTPEVFICPGDAEANAAEQKTEKPDKKDADADKAKEWWCFEKLTECSYSYQNQLGRTTRDNTDPRVVLVSDKCPMRADVQARKEHKMPKADSDPKKWTAWNSPNHLWMGQNLLFADGHVEWVESPEAGYEKNNIWIAETWDAEPHRWNPVDKGEYGRYDKSIEDKNDTWLVP